MPEKCSGLWRSEDMVLLQLHLQREAAHDTILKLGHLGCVQFRDMNGGVSAFQRLFTNDVRRCEDSERRIRYFEDQLRRDHSKRLRSTVGDGAEGGSTPETLDTLEPRLESLESELHELNAKWEQLLAQRNTLKEHLEVLTQEPSFFRGDTTEGEVLTGGIAGGDEMGGRMGGLKYLTGILKTDRVALFERLIFRATRGNVFMRTKDARDPFEDPLTGEKVEKTVFVVFFSAQRAEEKIRKLCESMQATVVPYVIDNLQERQNAEKAHDHLMDIDRTITGTEEVRADLLRKLKRDILQWKKTVVTEKSVYNILNMLSFKGQTVVAECWAPADDVDAIRGALSEAERSSGAQVESLLEIVKTDETAPTYFKTNKFTATHLGIVQSYGIARYKEVNPTCFSVVTFPFLFGVMYGDIGHGIMLTILAGLFIMKEKKLLATNLNEIIAIVFGGRYVLFMMGLFAIYLGFLYNDFFGMMIAPFGSPFWIFPATHNDLADCDDGYRVWYGANATLQRGCKKAGGHPYIFGVDAEWAEAENKLEFMNALKMKMAVILGVGQMMWGLVLQLLNHLYFGDMHHVWFGLIPEAVFLSCTFGYMCLMILIKWCTDWPARMLSELMPPSLLEAMTNFFLAPGSVEKQKYLYGSASAQNGFQSFLLLLAFFSVPLLLIPIPCIEWRHHKASSYGELQEHTAELVEEGPTTPNQEGQPKAEAAEHADTFDMSEIIIKQVIHTIEYVLGCVSNTASYLRLWALSLAHAQLSEVFWNFAWMKPLTMDKTGILVFIGWGIWGGATVAVLGVMESLSAFLHALRLHWVEFQNKFYYGDGILFVPYDVNNLIPKSFD